MYLPFNYEQINVVESAYQPADVKINSAAFTYWQRSLFQRACSLLDFTLPDDWTGKVRDFFYFCLFRFGYVAVFDHADFGIVFQPATLGGINFFYQPTYALIGNPALTSSLRLKIGDLTEDDAFEVFDGSCELLKLTPDYIGIWPIIDRYAQKLATLDAAIDMSIINNKFAFVLAAKNKSAQAALAKMMDKINAGEPAVILDAKVLNSDEDKKEPWQSWTRDHLKENYLTTDQLKDQQTIINAFDAEIGIPTTLYQKQERLTDYESRSRNTDSRARLRVWLDTLNASIDEVKKKFPDLTLSVRYRYEDTEGGADYAGDADDDRAL